MTFIETRISSAVHEIIERLDKKDEIISRIQRDMVQLRDENSQLRKRLEDVEAHQRRKTLIISGENLPVALSGENTAQVVCDVIDRKLGYKLSSDSIAEAHRIGRKPLTQNPDRRNILLKLYSDDIKEDLRQRFRTTKPAKLYINESLIPS